MNLSIQMPVAAKTILQQLHEQGYEAYIVGGCVRDALLGRIPDDWDITTNATPQQVKRVFSHTIDTGIQHGTVTVMVDKVGYEVTTYRVDGEYTDHRRPNDVTFTASLIEDMKRRDFTINAMAYNEEEGLVDHFHGQEDLRGQVIRCVGNPMERFDEDALRVLRALRFSAQLDFSIEEETLEAMKKQAVYLKDVSAERIRVELTKLLLSDHVERLLTIGYPCGITKVVLPEFDEMVETTQENPHHCYNVGEHCVKAVSYIEKDAKLRWTMLLHDIGKTKTKTVDEEGIAHFYKHAVVGAPLAVAILKRLKFDNDTIRLANELIYWHDYNWGQDITKKQVRKAAAKIGPQYMESLFKVEKADVKAQSTFMQQEKLALREQVVNCYREIVEETQCLTIKQLAINGQDLKDMGMRPGKQMGETLQKLLDIVLEAPEKNTKDQLTELVNQFLKG